MLGKMGLIHSDRLPMSPWGFTRFRANIEIRPALPFDRRHGQMIKRENARRSRLWIHLSTALIAMRLWRRATKVFLLPEEMIMILQVGRPTSIQIIRRADILNPARCVRRHASTREKSDCASRRRRFNLVAGGLLYKKAMPCTGWTRYVTTCVTP